MKAPKPLPIARRERGLSLVELMVALLIGLFLTAGVLALFAGTRQSVRLTEALSRVQENARFGVELLAHEVRQAGYKGGCLTAVNTLLDTSHASYSADRFQLDTGGTNARALGIRGWNGIAGEASAGSGTLSNHVAGTDTLLVRHAATATNLSASAALARTATSLSLNEFSGSLHDAIILITDGAGCDLFQNSAADNVKSLARATGGSPGNTTDDLSHDYDATLEILRLSSTLYFIAPGANGQNALWQRRFDKGGLDDDELIEGVQDMQISYGLDNDGDGALDQYVDASAVSNWSRVLAVHIELLLASTEDNLAETPMSLPFHLNDGSVFTAPDRRLYQMAVTTVRLRNHQP
ncbi:MAG: PilW family protein [Chromatiaceae bacterium]|nr:PilW family protein [Chromatiaceae bacterium]